MTPEQRDTILHALGLWQWANGRFNRRWSYRNHYCIAVHPTCAADIAPFVDGGWMVPGRTINRGQLRYYHVTDEGAREAGVLNRFRHEDRIKETQPCPPG